MKTTILVYYMSLAIVNLSVSIEIDPNGSLIERMIPKFQAEETKNIRSHKVPALGGETAGSLAEAVAQVEDLKSRGLVRTTRADKLIDTLRAMEEVQKVAALMDGSSLK
jgi:hypothetical protein